MRNPARKLGYTLIALGTGALHFSGTKGDVPAGLAIGGLLTAVGVLVVGWVHLPRRSKAGPASRASGKR